MLTKEKSPSVRQHQTDYRQNIFNVSIPQPIEAEKLAITMEPVVRDPIGMDSFKGNIQSFKSYLKAQRILLKTGIIV